MSRLEKFSLTSLLGIALAIGVSPSWAAERGTYRPGSPYQSVPTQDAPTCEQLCRADRECQGWNFVKVSPRQLSGVCEFNAQSVAPISSAISISGEGSVGQISSRIVSKGTRTIRVGAPETQNPTQVNAAPHNAPYSRQRIIREPIPVREPVTPGHYRSANQTRAEYSALSLTQQQALQRLGHAPQTQRSAPRLIHSLEGGVSTRHQPAGQHHYASPRNINPYTAPRNISAVSSPRLQHSLDGNAFVRPQNQNRFYAQRQAARATPQYVQKRHAYDEAEKLSVQQEKAKQYARTSSAQNNSIPRPQALTQPPRPQNIRTAEASLFGSLYDDVAQPKPLTQSEMADPNAPISTTKSVPAKKYNVDTLMSLAGRE